MSKRAARQQKKKAKAFSHYAHKCNCFLLRPQSPYDELSKFCSVFDLSGTEHFPAGFQNNP